MWMALVLVAVAGVGICGGGGGGDGGGGGSDGGSGWLLQSDASFSAWDHQRQNAMSPSGETGVGGNVPSSCNPVFPNSHQLLLQKMVDRHPSATDAFPAPAFCCSLQSSPDARESFDFLAQEVPEGLRMESPFQN